MEEKKIKLKNTKIEDFKYINNETLEGVILEEGITHIGERAFENCKNLKRIVLPDSIEYIGPGAFSGCENLEEIVLPKGIKKIPYRCFADCKRLKKIIIPNSVEEIEWASFTGCDSLEYITIPESVKKLDNQVFLNCKNLKNVNLPDNFTSLPDELFRNCPKLNIILSPKIKTLGHSVFENCYSLTNYPTNIKEAGENCFKNCRGLTKVILDDDIEELSNGLFDGCVYLENIIYSGPNQIQVGKKTFRNCKKLRKIPEFIANFNDRLFENCEGLTEIIPISSHIPFACFRGCKNIRKINEASALRKIDSYAFSGCENLESIELKNLRVIKPEAFSNCKRLRKVKLPFLLQRIESRAFFNCPSLEEINLPDSVERVGKEAFRGCNSIRSIRIPASLKTFGDGAFSYMDSLEDINVSPENKIFISPDHKMLLNQVQQKLVLYASGLKDKSYSLKDYVIQTDFVKNQTLVSPISYIGECAFAGAKHLEELSVCGCTKDIEASAFDGCDNLKKLNVLAVEFSSCPGFAIRDHGRYYTKGFAKKEAFIPFEHVEFSGDLVQIFPRALQNFTNVKKLTLPNEHTYGISNNAFDDCTQLTEVDIPNEVVTIQQNAFPKTSRLIFKNGLSPEGLVELIHNNEYIGDYKLYVLHDGTYYIEQGDKITTLSKQYIDEVCSKSSFIRDNPVLFLDFMNSLLDNDLGIKPLFNGILMKYMSIPNRQIMIDNLKKDDEFFLTILAQSGILDNDDDDTKKLLKDDNFNLVVKHVNTLRKKNIRDMELSNKLLIAHQNPESFKKMVDNDLDLLRNILKESKLLAGTDTSKQDKDFAVTVLEKNALANFISLIKKYNIKDKFLYNKAFISIANNPLFEELLKVYDANTKRLFKMSETLNDITTTTQNLNDLLILMKVSGALESDPIERQKASTFITEKLFEKTLPNGTSNSHRIVGDDIHRVFNFPTIREEFDKEFAEFFRENYHELVKEERIKSGFIQRVYTNFREISKTSTSDRGSQRKLKVTIDKCKGYLSEVKFDGVNRQNRSFAYLIGEWYDKNETWIKAQSIFRESLEAPRNIFTKIKIDGDGKKIYDYNPDKDLKDKPNYSFQFEWLPKQDYENLVLGKHCNCCAHIEGAGQGIMRASMILENCQNLVIRNQFGEIISKSTLFVNRGEGYAVFNTVETSLNYRKEEDLKEIYKAFMRGAKAFVKEYNKNNPACPITYMTIGGKRNTIIDQMKSDKHPTVPIKKSLDYGKYSLNGSGYYGDWSSTQKLVLKK